MAERAKPRARPYLAAAAAFASGTDTPRQFLERCLETIAQHEPAILAFAAMDADGARAAADISTERWRARRPLSPIDGMPVGIKDVIETRSMPTGMGSALFAGWRSDRDSASVMALKEAGAVILGKTVTTEFAATGPGPTRNPWDLARTPGGSSSGSAAGVAAGFISAGLGTQVVGSILRPASYCGVVGFKPTLGAINRGGSHDYMSQSCQGVIAATFDDAWAVAREIGTRAGGDPGFPGLYGPETQPLAKTPRAIVLLETAGLVDASADARAQLELVSDCLTGAGIELRTRSRDAQVAAVEEAIAQALPLTRLINTWESRWPLNTYRERDAGKLSAAMRDRVHEAEELNLDAYRVAIAERARVRTLYAALADFADVCLTLAAPGEAPLGLRSTGNPVFVVPGSLLGVPAVTLPLLEAGGLPLGLQLLGFEHRDADLFAATAAMEQIVGQDHGARA